VCAVSLVGEKPPRPRTLHQCRRGYNVVTLTLRDLERER
jgi:hypothetical protein